jgi:hypothetical protein
VPGVCGSAVHRPGHADPAGRGHQACSRIPLDIPQPQGHRRKRRDGGDSICGRTASPTHSCSRPPRISTDATPTSGWSPAR